MKRFREIISLALAAALVISDVPVTLGNEQISKVVTAFNGLDENVAYQFVPAGAKKETLNLPSALTAAVETEMSRPVTVTSPSGLTEAENVSGPGLNETEAGYETVYETAETEITGVTWTCDYYNEETGMNEPSREYEWRAVLPEGYTLAEGAQAPVIYALTDGEMRITPLAVYEWKDALPPSIPEGTVVANVTLSGNPSGTLTVPGGATVTVTGDAVTSQGINLDIGADAQVTWRAQFSGNAPGRALIIYKGGGTLEIAGGWIRREGSGDVIDAQGSLVRVTGQGAGAATVHSGTGTAIKGSGPDTEVIIDGGSVMSDATSNLSPVIDMTDADNTGMNVTIIGGSVTALSFTSYGYAVQTFGGVTANGGEIISYADLGRCVNLVGRDSAAIVNGGRIIAEGDRGVGISTATTGDPANKVADTSVEIHGGEVFGGANAVHTTGSDSAVTISGGSVSSANRSAVLADGDRSSVTVTGGVVSTEAWAPGSSSKPYPYYAVETKTGGGVDVSVSGGFVFAYGSGTKNVVKKAPFTPAGDGVLTAWDIAQGVTEYLEGSNRYLSVSPGSAAVTWHDNGERDGIRYGSGGFFPLPVTIVSQYAYGLLFDADDGKLYADINNNQAHDVSDPLYTADTSFWTAEKGTLTLNGFNFRTYAPVALTVTGVNPVIDVSGANTFQTYVPPDAREQSVKRYGLYSKSGSLTITGEGRLGFGGFSAISPKIVFAPAELIGIKSEGDIIAACGTLQAVAATLRETDAVFGADCAGELRLTRGLFHALGEDRALARPPVIGDSGVEYTDQAYSYATGNVITPVLSVEQLKPYNGAAPYNVPYQYDASRQMLLNLGPYAVVSDVTVAGSMLAPLTEMKATVTVNGDTVLVAPGTDATGWFGNEPAGVRITAEASADGSKITLTFSGTPLALSSAVFNISLPALIFENWKERLPVARNQNAKFNIGGARSYTIAYDKNGGEGTMEPAAVPYGGRHTVPACGFSQKGHRFVGWGTGAASVPEFVQGDLIDNVTRDITLYALWQAENYAVIFDANGGGGEMARETATWGQSFTLPTTAFARTGYVFKEWNTRADGAGARYADGYRFSPWGLASDELLAYAPGSDGATLRLYAQWTPVPYTVSFNGNGGAGSMAAQTAAYGKNLTLAPNQFNKTGHRFAGWSVGRNGVGHSYGDGYTFIPWETVGDLTLYAQWTPENASVRFMLNDEGMPETHYAPGEEANRDKAFGQPLADFARPGRAGYRFDGWFDAASGGREYTPGTSTIDAVPLTLYARWTAYTVRYDANSRDAVFMPEASFPGTVNTNGLYIVSDSLFALLGHTFREWNTKPDGTGVSYAAGQVIQDLGADLVLYAQWTPVETKIHFDANGGAGDISPATATWGQSFTLPAAAFIRTGYTFDGWNTQPDGGGALSYADGQPIAAWNRTENALTLYARWKHDATATPSTVTYHADNGTDLSVTEKVAFGASHIVRPQPADFTRPKHQFKGWNTEADGSGTDYSPGMVIGDVRAGFDLHAVWTPADREGADVGGGIKNEEDGPIYVTVIISNGFSRLDITTPIYVPAGATVPYQFTGIPDGWYNITAQQVVFNVDGGVQPVGQIGTSVHMAGGKPATADILVFKAVQYVTGISYNEGMTDEEYFSLPPIAADGLAELLEAEENTKAAEEMKWIENGGVVGIVLVVDAVAEETRTALAEAAEDGGFRDILRIEYADLSVFKTFSLLDEKGTVESAVQLHELPRTLHITVTLKDFPEGGAAAVYREHAGRILPLATRPDGNGEYFRQDGEYIELYVNRFSSYAFVTGTADDGGSENGGGDNGNGNNDNDGKRRISFNPNGGSGSKSPLWVEDGSDYTLPSGPFTRTGYTFAGWKIGNAGGTLLPGTVVTVNGSMVLYAQWIGPEGGGAESESDDISGVPDDGIVLSPPPEDGEDAEETGESGEAGPEASPAEVAFEQISGVLNTSEHFAYVNGIGNHKFAPDMFMTRAEAAHMFYNLLLDKNVPAAANRFHDVPEREWYAAAVNTLAAIGIVTGFSDGGFRPKGYITRAELVVMAGRFTDAAPGGITFIDVPVTHWAHDYISSALNRGWIEGVGNGRFAPDMYVTRAEAVTHINRLLDRRADLTFVKGNAGVIRYIDLLPAHWAYYEITEASQSHVYEKIGDEERWKGLKPF